MKKEQENPEKLSTSYFLQQMQEKNGKVYNRLLKINRLVKNLENKVEDLKYDSKHDILHDLNIISHQCQAIEVEIKKPVSSPGENEKYHIRLVSANNFGILKINRPGNPEISIQFQGKMFEILYELIKTQIEHTDLSVPDEFHGYVLRSSLEQKLYGSDVKKNCLNSHITRIRTVLIQNGITETPFIKSFEKYVRLNIKNAEYRIINVLEE